MLPTVLRDLPTGDFAFCLAVMEADDERLVATVRHAQHVQAVIDLGDS